MEEVFKFNGSSLRITYAGWETRQKDNGAPSKAKYSVAGLHCGPSLSGFVIKWKSQAIIGKLSVEVWFFKTQTQLDTVFELSAALADEELTKVGVW